MTSLAVRGLLGLLVPIAALAGPSAASAQSPPRVEARAVSRSADTVRVGCFGGVRGSGTGNLLTRAGQLTSYRKPLHAVATYTPLRRDSAAASAVFAELERIRFRTLRHNQVGNMTCALELRDEVGKHSVTWLEGRPPAALEPVLAALGRAFGDDPHQWP